MERADGDDGAAYREPAVDDRALCFAHIQDRYLDKELRGAAFDGRCAFCPADARGPVQVVLVGRLADTVLFALSGYDCPADAPVEWPHGDSHKALPDPQAVAEACDPVLDTDVLKAVQDYIDQREWYGDPVAYVPRSSAVRDSWAGLCRTVAERDLDLPDTDPSPGSDRDRLESLMGRIADIVRDENLVIRIEPGVKIWRGRMRSDKTLPGYRAADIGSVPPERAAENRMSRAGVPLFYGSAAAGTAVVEISARDGRPFAAVAAFETTRPLRLLDLVDIPEPPSLFDRSQVARRDSLVFLRDFARDLSRPVFYDGRKHRDYRPTQYLTDHFRQSAEVNVEGIRFRSAHDGGVNYALFVDATQCLDPDAVDGQGTLRLIEGAERVADLDRCHATQAV
ncbi:RES family NAD+ phosphorylase [Streptomyces canus]|uniref:RES family NAD+ phosphorylase n=1 Tax=Streptomyces canus TaxID=58343 RepID=UPI00225641A3|nr:RES family NAD+ phosphorylase [Streptomyces canus]MCX5252800.1 RES family NAD+ phosphorylase [Streptomyces canus]